jgi:hypothetical protein
MYEGKLLLSVQACLQAHGLAVCGAIHSVHTLALALNELGKANQTKTNEDQSRRSHVISPYGLDLSFI